MNHEDIAFTLDNYERILAKYLPLIKNCTYLLHKQYHLVLEYEDAMQHVKMCMWLCLKHYNPEKFKFMTYFYFSFERLRKSLYYEYRSQIEVKQKTKEFNGTNADGENPTGTTNYYEEQFNTVRTESVVSYVHTHSTGVIEIDIRCKLSDDCVPVFDLYMKSFKISPWLVSKELNVSRYHGRLQYRKFLEEVANLLQVAI